MTDHERSPRTALLLSLCFPGLGQFYNREWIKGGLFLVGGIVLSEFALSDVRFDELLSGLPPPSLAALARNLVILTGFLLWCGYDAWKSARAGSDQ